MPALVLLTVCALINFADRGNLSIAAPLLKDEVHFSASQLGILPSGFFWTYTALQFVVRIGYRAAVYSNPFSQTGGCQR